MACNVYTAQYHGAPNHIALFVRPSHAQPKASGKCFHVTGTILAGMKFEVRDRESPLVAPDHVLDTMVLIGYVREGDMDRFEETCRTVPPPEPQMKLNGKPEDSSKSLRRCREWVEEAIEKLRAEGIISENFDSDQDA